MMWMNGEVTSATARSFDLADRGLLLGDGLFETVLVAGGVPFLRSAHLARMEAGAGVLRLKLDMRQVAAALDALASRLDAPGVVRVTVTRGVAPRGLAIPDHQTPTVFATAAPWSPAGAFKPQHLRLATIRRNDTSPLANVKSLNYLDNVLALDAAVEAGGDEALLLSTRGHVACTAAANVFVLKGDRLATPPLGDGVLPGTVRALLLARAGSCGLAAEERSLTGDDLGRADAVFTTNSLRLMSRSVSLDGEPLPCGGTEPLRRLTQVLVDAIAHDCGWRCPMPDAGFGDAPPCS